MANIKGVVSVHYPSHASRSEEGRNSRCIGIGVSENDECLQDAGVNHETDCTDHAKAQEPTQGSARGGAICR